MKKLAASMKSVDAYLCRQRQRGGVLMVSAIVLVVIVSSLVVTLAYITSAGLSSGAGHNESAQAYAAARSGIEYATMQYANGTACASINASNQAVGLAAFSVAGTAYTPSAVNVTIDATQTFIPVSSLTGYAPSGRVRVEFEEIDYAATSTSSSACGGAAPCLLVSRRGAGGTTASAHAAQPANQDVCHVRSTGTAGSATRYIDRVMQAPVAMMAYAKYNTGLSAAILAQPYYRIWPDKATGWGSEFAADAPAGAASPANNVNHLLMRMARTRNEALLASVENNGRVRLQVWNGFSWAYVTGTGVGADGLITTQNINPNSTTVPNTRGIDIAYERSRDRAIIVYADNNATPLYRIWNGSTLSNAVRLSAAAELNAALPTGGYPQWVEMAASPMMVGSNSNDVLLMVLSSTRNTTGVRWNGARWGSLEAGAPTVWNTTLVSNTANCIGTNLVCEAISVDYEQQSGHGMFLWTLNTANAVRYRTWDPAAVPTLGTVTALASTNMNGAGTWLNLYPQPGSNNIMVGYQDSSLDLNTRLWNGSAWDAQARHPEHTGNAQITQNKVYGLAFETHQNQAGRAWIFYGDSGTSTARRNEFNPSLSANCIAGTATCWAGAVSIGDNTARTDLMAHPGTGTVHALLYENSAAAANEELLESHTTPPAGGTSAWTAIPPAGGAPAAAIIWAGVTNQTNPAGRQTMAARPLIIILTREYFP